LLTQKYVQLIISKIGRFPEVAAPALQAPIRPPIASENVLYYTSEDVRVLVNLVNVASEARTPVVGRLMHNGKHASPNGHPQPVSATSPSAPMKSVKLVLRQKSAPKVPQDGPPGTPLEVLERELPPRTAFVDQIPLADIVDRLVQDAYSKLVELSDTYVPGNWPLVSGSLPPHTVCPEPLPTRARETSKPMQQRPGRNS